MIAIFSRGVHQPFRTLVARRVRYRRYRL